MLSIYFPRLWFRGIPSHESPLLKMLSLTAPLLLRYDEIETHNIYEYHATCSNSHDPSIGLYLVNFGIDDMRSKYFRVFII